PGRARRYLAPSSPWDGRRVSDRRWQRRCRWPLNRTRRRTRSTAHRGVLPGARTAFYRGGLRFDESHPHGGLAATTHANDSDRRRHHAHCRRNLAAQRHMDAVRVLAPRLRRLRHHFADLTVLRWSLLTRVESVCSKRTLIGS